MAVIDSLVSPLQVVVCQAVASYLKNNLSKFRALPSDVTIMVSVNTDDLGYTAYPMCNLQKVDPSDSAICNIYKNRGEIGELKKG